MFSWLIALVPAALFVRGFRKDRRQVSNAVWLGVTVVVSALVSTTSTAVDYALVLVMLGVSVVLPVAIVFNGLEMARRESRRLANLLSFVAGLVIIAIDISFLVIAQGGTGPLQTVLGAGVLIAGYVGFFCTSVLLYSMMRDYLLHKGLSGILVEDKSTTTEENLRFSTELLRAHRIEGPVAAVTSNYHAFRAAVTARSLGLPTNAVGAPTARYYLPSAFLREVVALLRENVLAHTLFCGAIVAMYVIVVLL